MPVWGCLGRLRAFFQKEQRTKKKKNHHLIGKMHIIVSVIKSLSMGFGSVHFEGNNLN